MSGGGSRRARRRHPYFGFLTKGSAVELSFSGRRNPHEPSMTPENEEGVLWAAYRQVCEYDSTDA